MHSEHYLPRTVPAPLQGLVELAKDLRWTWYHGQDSLWRQLDPALWRATANPWLILESVSELRLDSLAKDKAFLARLQQLLDDREAHFQAGTWFSRQYGGHWQGNIAYFSMEFGLSESLPIYSGGLGVLAGDLLKTACDLGVPLIGIGLLYQQGYFRQAINGEGQQMAFYPYNDPTMLPVVPLRDQQGSWVRVPLALPGRTLFLRAWSARVGRRSLFLLDSNDPLNEPGDRGITSELYGGGLELRLRQEMVLGIGGMRLLQMLGISCPVCHLNEGHAAFAVLERARQFKEERHCGFFDALQATRAGNLLTLHTPVAAGFDRFPEALLRYYLGPYLTELELDMAELLALGRNGEQGEDHPFNMVWLAVRGCGAINGVSQLHGQVSRRLLQPLFPRWPEAEVPVGHVTNGVHMPSWDSAVADKVWTAACGKPRWRGELECVDEALKAVSDGELWRMRCEGRRQLLDYLALRLERQRRGCPAPPVLDPDALTLGLARRFAEYKRPCLLLDDPDRLARLLSSRDRAVQLVVAGKAHPSDSQGQALLRRWHQFMQREDVRGRVLFVEDYDLNVAAQLVQGVDLWINTPRRPWEACGTSGMKVLVNGGLNLSVLDGWWAQAFEPGLGWALGDGREHRDVAAWDARDGAQLLALLEQEVIPLFFERDEQGIPKGWLAMMRRSMAVLTPRFSSNRMLRQYTEQYYLPLAGSYQERRHDHAELAAWQKRLAAAWPQLRFGALTVGQGEGSHHFEVQLYLGELDVEAVQVELYADAAEGLPAFCLALTRGKPLVGARNGFSYHGEAPADRPADAYTPRVVPHRQGLSVPLEARQILWHH
ncbi:alpha-glucan family phosphorylase [Gallaecimonas kandeliae]|uniref:alpha-glucan family phosphorylase n=1 Tax=Gallaecimonas kandeliae TaxID=3029055 RepID=UPI002648291E|nr:alpha-glucan family phosphorylase [Gallaecimonas kandeliae]WKE64810.1 alpha-glucan family phosphorylase [Gallaecimonas kandeliae]